MPIAPKTFGDSLNEWFRTLGRNWKPLLLTSLIVHIPVGLVVFSLLWASGDSLVVIFDPERLEDMTGDEALDLMVPVLWAGGVWTVLQGVAGVFVYLAGARIVAQDLAGERPSTGAVTRFAAGRSPAALAGALVVLTAALLTVAVPVVAGWALVSGVGLDFTTVFVISALSLTAFVVLLWLGVSVSFYLHTVALERASPWQSLRRSFSLVQGRWWPTLGFMLVTGIVASAASQIVSIVLIPVYAAGALVPELLALGLAAGVVLQGPVLAAIGAAYAVWYIDLRARQETLEPGSLV